MFETALEPGEIITALRFPVPSAGGLCQIQIAGVALRGGRRVRGEEPAKVRVAVTGAGPGVFRVAATEAALERDVHAVDAVAAIKRGVGKPELRYPRGCEYRAASRDRDGEKEPSIVPPSSIVRRVVKAGSVRADGVVEAQ